MVELDERVVWVVEHELEIFEESVLLRTHGIRQERVTVLSLKIGGRLLLEGETPERSRRFDLFYHWLGRHLHGDCRHIQIKTFNNLQILGMAQILIFYLPVGPKLLNVSSQNAHLLIEVIRKVKIIELAQPQLVVIVIQ